MIGIIVTGSYCEAEILWLVQEYFNSFLIILFILLLLIENIININNKNIIFTVYCMDTHENVNGMCNKFESLN